ncbi:hypothetical protein N7520_004300 [Penicillium odoratum]|uniref:uncharacterized protein n=1 Tax=Penicillium odoratum TaxID=1167516 RepID=UPI0025467FD3|nr:uncharacterized protein N7520_004300 [Penicillium odoratum]KAJ5764741.1 hypothetical protein N7520_004300 [Penicillium odoratum]
MSTMEKVFTQYAKRTAVLEASSNPLAQGVAWIEGEHTSINVARIPLLDQGFLHSDLTYDVPAVWDGRFFRLDDHLNRLEQSCKKLQLQIPIPKEEIKTILVGMVAKSGIRDAYVELIVTRGLKSVRSGKLEELKNNLYLFVIPYAWISEPEEQRTGGSAIISRTVRRCPPGSMDPTVKNFQWGDLVRGLIEANDRGAMHPFLTDGDANLTEGSGYNIVLIKDGVLYTPDRGVLEGITRKSVMDAAAALGYKVRLEIVPTALAYTADEILICSTAGGVMPITSLDGEPVKDGKIGPITSTIWDKYWAMHYESAYSFAIKY